MKAILTLAVAATLGGCAVAPHSASVYRSYQTQNEQIVRMGQVESVRDVIIANRDTGTGTTAGAALGGLAGSNIGGGTGSIAAGHRRRGGRRRHRLARREQTSTTARASRSPSSSTAASCAPLPRKPTSCSVRANGYACSARATPPA